MVREDDGGGGKEAFGVVDDNKSSVGVCRRSIWVWPRNNRIYRVHVIKF